MDVICCLGKRIIFFECFVVSMFMATAISAGFRIEWLLNKRRMHTKTMKHLHKNRVVLQLQIIRTHLQHDMPIAQMIGRPRQVDGRIGHHPNQLLRLCLYSNDAAVIGHENITWLQDLAAGNK